MSFGAVGLAFTVRGVEGADDRHLNGFVYDLDRYPDRTWVPIRSVDLDSEYDDDAFVLRNRVRVHTDDHTYDVRGDVWSAIPLRNRRNGLVTRITEGVTRWTYGDLRGVGLTEHLDQIIDGVPVGVAAGA